MHCKLYTNDEINAILDNAHLPMHLSLWQGLRVSLWLMFNHKRVCLFCWYLENGKPVLTAYLEAVDSPLI